MGRPAQSWPAYFFELVIHQPPRRRLENSAETLLRVGGNVARVAFLLWAPVVLLAMCAGLLNSFTR
jgi:hypothetical protein